MYAMVCTRPDLAQAMSCVKICQIRVENIDKLSNGFSDIWRAQGTWALCLKDNMERRVSPVSWTPIMREIWTCDGLPYVMLLLAVEDRYVGDLCSNQLVLYLLWKLNTWLMEVAKKVIWFKGLVNEIGLKQDSVKVKWNSQSAICLMKNQVFLARMKHIEVCYHRIRDWVSAG